MPRPPRGILGITGTPGTGKKSIAPEVAKMLGVPCLGLNEFAKARGMTASDEGVDVGRLGKALDRQLVAPSVVFGHLLPYSVGRSKVSRVVVLRCEPSILKERLRSRGYPAAKVLENVEAELIGTVYADALKAFGKWKTFEVDTSLSAPSDAAAEVASIARGAEKTREPIDWLPDYDSGPRLRALLAPPGAHRPSPARAGGSGSSPG